MATEQPNLIQSEYSSIEKQYERKVLWTRLVPVLQKGGLFLWSVIDLVLVFGTLAFFAWYLVQGIFSEQQLVARIGQNHTDQRSLIVSQQATGLVLSNTLVLPGSEGQYDLYATVGNPNESWLVTFTYFFETSAGNTDSRKGYVLPGGEQAIVELSNEAASRPGRAELKIENIEWERIKNIPGGDIKTWLADRGDFKITDIKHGAITKIGDRDIVQTAFTIANQSAYSYWDIDVVLLLKVGRNIVGVNQIRIPSLDAAETASKTVSWFWTPSAGATPEVIPQINFFDANVYKANPTKTTGETSEQL